MSGPNLADGLWSVAVGAAAQLSIERGVAVIYVVLPRTLMLRNGLKRVIKKGRL